jgi:hypothetical protein
MGGQPKSEASSLSSPDVRALWEEPTVAILQNQRDQAVAIHYKGVEDVKESRFRYGCCRIYVLLPR